MDLTEFKKTKLGSALRWVYRKANGIPTKTEPPADPCVLAAMALPQSSAQPFVSAALAEYVNVESTALSSREIFSLNGRTLPCWVDSDETPEDDWLTNTRGYPLYHALFEKVLQPARRRRFLEIGVRTGYVGAVFARAAVGPAFYLGIDPNLYMENGLMLAGDTFRLLRAAKPPFEAVLIEGYSWGSDIQKSLAHSAPFDLIHIDGDHSLRGKLIDLNLCRRLITQDGLVLVDDWFHVPPVRDAIDRALRLGWYSEFAPISTMRGLGVLRGAKAD